LRAEVKAERTIELVREFHDFAGHAVTRRKRRELENFSCPGNGVIPGDDTLIAKAETTSQVKAVGQVAKVVGGFCGGDGKAVVKVGQENR
jgi:hypothetical protein